MNHRENIRLTTFEGAATVLNCKKEHWGIIATTHNPFDLSEKENVEIKIEFVGGYWKGTIQDFKAIKSYAKNSLAALQNIQQANQFLALKEEIEELTQLLSHFHLP